MTRATVNRVPLDTACNNAPESAAPLHVHFSPGLTDDSHQDELGWRHKGFKTCALKDIEFLDRQDFN